MNLADRTNSGHLSDAQFADLMAGGAAGEKATEHVGRCARCCAELEAVGVAVGDLNRLSLRWAEQRAAAIPTPTRWALEWSGTPLWGATMAALLIAGVAIGARMQMQTSQAASTATTQSVQTASAPSSDELVRDNRLLRSIDDELSVQAPVQVPVADLGVATDRSRAATSREVAN